MMFILLVLMFIRATTKVCPRKQMRKDTQRHPTVTQDVGEAVAMPKGEALWL